MVSKIRQSLKNINYRLYAVLLVFGLGNLFDSVVSLAAYAVFLKKEKIV